VTPFLEVTGLATGLAAAPAGRLVPQSQTGATPLAGRRTAAALASAAQAIRSSWRQAGTVEGRIAPPRLVHRLPINHTVDGRALKFLNVIDEYSRLALAMRAGRRCRAAEMIDTNEELLKLYTAPTHLRMDNGPEFIANALQEWCVGTVETRPTSRHVHPRRSHLWNRSTAASEMSS